jgi:hypothetical protein
MRAARTVGVAAALLALLALPVTAFGAPGGAAAGARQRAPLERVGGTVVEKLVVIAILGVECSGTCRRAVRLGPA